MKKSGLILAAFLLLCSCAATSKVQVLKPEGEKIKLTLRDSRMYEFEILAVSDSLLYLSDGRKLSLAPLSDVQNIRVHWDSIDAGSKVLGAIPPLILEGIVMGAAFHTDQTGWGVASIAAMGVTIFGFATANPKVNFSFPLEKDKLTKLRLYCRYPQGLTDEQWKLLLQRYRQTDFILLPKE